jgi:hypothetical protein
LTRIKARPAPFGRIDASPPKECIMSKIDIIYLGIVLFAFGGFAAVLAYYSQTCADPEPKQKEQAGQRPRLAAAH